MSGLFWSLRQRNDLMLLATNPFFYFLPFFLFLIPPFFFSASLLFSNLYCLMDSTFLIVLAVPCKIEFCKVPTLYDIPKLHTKSFGKNPCASIIIGTIIASLSHILAISNRISDQLSCFLFRFRIRLLPPGHRTSIIKHLFIFFLHNRNIRPPMFYLSIHLNTYIPLNFHDFIFNDRLNIMFVPPFTYFYFILLS